MPVTPPVLTTVSDSKLNRREEEFASLSSVSIRRVIRTMRGGSQARLVECANGFWVAKFAGNPQGNRVLINELVSNRILTHLGITTPKVQLLELPPEQIERVFFQIGNKRVLPLPGAPHFGSRCAANPDKKAIFDLLPTKLFSKIVNIEEFATMFAADRWLYNTDKRQAVYTRVPGKDGEIVFKASFIDHGHNFGGAQWQFHDPPLNGTTFDLRIYSLIDMRALTKIAVQRIEAIPAEILQSAANGIPDAWLATGDHERLTQLLLTLSSRRQRLSSIVARHLSALKL